MANISEQIERFILLSLGDSEFISIGRNQLAQHFDCSPSQINYVLQTRFTIERGYFLESKRGGGGYIEIVKIKPEGKDYLVGVINTVEEEISEQKAAQIVCRLVGDGRISKREGEIILAATTSKSLSNPFLMQDRLRAQILVGILRALTKTL